MVFHNYCLWFLVVESHLRGGPFLFSINAVYVGDI